MNELFTHTHTDPDHHRSPEFILPNVTLLPGEAFDSQFPKGRHLGSGAFFNVHESSGRCRKDLINEDFDAQRGAMSEALTYAREGKPVAIAYSMGNRLRSIAVPLARGLTYKERIDHSTDSVHAGDLLGYFAHDIASDLKRAHYQGITNGDIKLENVVRQPDHQPSVIVDRSNSVIHPLSSAWRSDPHFAFGNPEILEAWFIKAASLLPAVTKVNALKRDSLTEIIKLMKAKKLHPNLSDEQKLQLAQHLYQHRTKLLTRELKTVYGRNLINDIVNEISPITYDYMLFEFTRHPKKQTILHAIDRLVHHDITNNLWVAIQPHPEIPNSEEAADTATRLFGSPEYPGNRWAHTPPPRFAISEQEIMQFADNARLMTKALGNSDMTNISALDREQHLRQTNHALKRLRTRADEAYRQGILTDWRQLLEEVKRTKQERNAQLQPYVDLERADNVLTEATQTQNISLADREIPKALGV